MIVIEKVAETPKNSNNSLTAEKKLRIIVYILSAIVILLTIVVFFLLNLISNTNGAMPLLKSNTPEPSTRPITTAAPSTELPQDVRYDDGTYTFIIPDELYLSKNPTDPGGPYAQLKTKQESSIQIDLSSELELSCVEIDKQEVVTINGEPLNKVFYKGLKNSELLNCQTDNSSFRAIWIHLPLWVENIGRPTLAISYDLADHQTAVRVYEEMLDTLTFAPHATQN